MQAKQIVARVEELVKPLCEQAGVSLWDVEFEKEGGQYMLTVTVDRPEGVNIDQCEQVSRALDPMLDEKEFDDMPSYTLCVSSAGMSRRLKRPEHFQAFMGQTVEVGFYKPMNGMKQIEGTLVGYDNGAVTLEVNGAVIELDKDGAHFVSSPCPDKICVNKGIIKRAGESAVCLPQRVSVRIEGGDSEIDSVTG